MLVAVLDIADMNKTDLRHTTEDYQVSLILLSFLFIYFLIEV